MELCGVFDPETRSSTGNRLVPAFFEESNMYSWGLATLAVLVFTASIFAADPVHNEATDKQVARINEALPRPWSAHAEGNDIVIEYAQTIDLRDNHINPQGGPQGEGLTRPGRPRLTLEFVPILTQADLQALNKKNSDRGMALQMLAAEMKDMVNNGMPIGDQGGYRAANADQQARLDAYVAVVRALPFVEPPTLFASDAAFRWMSPGAMPVDASVRNQMSEIRSKVEALFSAKPVK
jgi:hypothetical protein